MHFRNPLRWERSTLDGRTTIEFGGQGMCGPRVIVEAKILMVGRGGLCRSMSIEMNEKYVFIMFTIFEYSLCTMQPFFRFKAILRITTNDGALAFIK